MLRVPNQYAVLPMREQIHGRLKTLITSDRCQVGQKLPASRELARQFEVSLATIQAAMRRMEQEGLVSCKVRQGTFVRRTLAPEEIEREGRSTIPVVAVLTGASHRHDLSQPGRDWSAGILYGIQERLMELGYALQLLHFDSTKEPLSVAEARISRMANSLLGLISFPFTHEDELLPAADRMGLPWITINQYNHLSTRNYVTADYYGGGVEAGKLFARLGRERILYIQSSEYSYSALQKENGLRDGLSAGKISPKGLDVLMCKSWLNRDGYDSTTRFLQEVSNPPQAIFTSGDLLALGAMKACQDRGLRVPDDVAVVGSTGLEAGEHSTPTLSTVKLPMMEMGREAAEMLLSLVKRNERVTAGKIIPTELVLRGSTPPLPAATRKF